MCCPLIHFLPLLLQHSGVAVVLESIPGAFSWNGKFLFITGPQKDEEPAALPLTYGQLQGRQVPSCAHLQSTWREATLAQREHANPTQEEPQTGCELVTLLAVRRLEPRAAPKSTVTRLLTPWQKFHPPFGFFWLACARIS